MGALGKQGSSTQDRNEQFPFLQSTSENVASGSTSPEPLVGQPRKARGASSHQEDLQHVPYSYRVPVLGYQGRSPVILSLADKISRRGFSFMLMEVKGESLKRVSTFRWLTLAG